MERLVIRFGGNPAVPCKFDLDFAVDLDKKTWNGLKEIFDALADVYDILGDNYNLDQLREIVQADRDGRCKVLPFAPGTTIYEADGDHGVVKHSLEDSAHFVINSNAVADDGTTWYDYWTDDDVDNAHKTREEAEAALKERRGE